MPEMTERQIVNAVARAMEGAKTFQFNSSTTLGRVYTAFIMPDGETSCDCPGWIYKQRAHDDGKVMHSRECKHTRSLIEARKHGKV